MNWFGDGVGEIVAKFIDVLLIDSGDNLSDECLFDISALLKEADAFLMCFFGLDGLERCGIPWGSE